VIPTATVVPLVDASDKRFAAEIEAHIQQLDYPFITFVSVYPQPHLRGDLPKMSIFVGTDGTHQDRAVADVVHLALKQEHLHLQCTLMVESRRGRVR
jgi:hypothetical protein